MKESITCNRCGVVRITTYDVAMRVVKRSYLYPTHAREGGVFSECKAFGHEWPQRRQETRWH